MKLMATHTGLAGLILHLVVLLALAQPALAAQAGPAGAATGRRRDGHTRRRVIRALQS